MLVQSNFAFFSSIGIGAERLLGQTVGEHAVIAVNDLSPHRYAYIDASAPDTLCWGLILVHICQNVPNLPHPQVDLATSGRYGVQLFFVASALTLMLSWHARSDGALPFYIRRVFRIAPMFWLAIPFYSIIFGLGPRYGIGRDHLEGCSRHNHFLARLASQKHQHRCAGWVVYCGRDDILRSVSVFGILASFMARVIAALVFSIILARLAGDAVEGAFLAFRNPA